ncbi:TetR/AcrR family transcriptional regulator [Asanoa sp. NPDC049518]|uniref:TetR/AcrR family transcriptional regulator n=1 Tax=unclassified Asanoa TaxID=2685164 RepID=UPI003428C2AC
MRADGVRNRRRVLDAAMAAFATDGLSIPVAEVARRAGVGTGTVSRHFPTKESLYEAIVSTRVAEIVGRAEELAATHPPGEAFYAFLRYMVDQAAENRGLAEALAGAGFDIEAAAASGGHDLAGTEAGLLARAQEAGAVRPDVTTPDVKALIVGCLAREQTGPDAIARNRMVQIVSAGLLREAVRDPVEDVVL